MKVPVRLIHLHAVLENTQLPCYCNLGEGLEDYFILVEMAFSKRFCKRTKFRLGPLGPCIDFLFEYVYIQRIISSTSKLHPKKPLKISEEQIRWAMSEAITDDGKT